MFRRVILFALLAVACAEFCSYDVYDKGGVAPRPYRQNPFLVYVPQTVVQAKKICVNPVKLEATVCETEPPLSKVKVLDELDAIVYRNSAPYSLPAILQLTLWCDPPYPILNQNDPGTLTTHALS